MSLSGHFTIHTINEVALSLITTMTERIYEFDNPDYFKMTLAEINGIVNLADELKKEFEDDER